MLNLNNVNFLLEKVNINSIPDDNILNRDDRFTLIASGAGMSRILTHIQSGVPFITISAFKQHLSKKENRKRNRLLINDARDLGMGGIQIEGHYVYRNDVGEKVDSIEESFFLTPRDKSFNINKILEITKFLVKKYEQECACYGNSDNVFLYSLFEDGSEKIDVLGKQTHIKLDDIEGGYSKIKNVKFIYSGIRKPNASNWLSSMFFNNIGLYCWLDD